MYGKELILDIWDCDTSKFNRKDLDRFFKELCKKIEMVKCTRYWWDDLDTPEEDRVTEPHLKGTSAVQFIMTSDIVIHTLDILERVYINVFSCKDYDDKVVKEFVIEFFGGYIKSSHTVGRH